MKKLTAPKMIPTNVNSLGIKMVIIIPREKIKKITKRIIIFTNFPAGTHSVYIISSFFWLLSSLILLSPS